MSYYSRQRDDIKLKTIYNCCMICHKETTNSNPFYICDNCLKELKMKKNNRKVI